MEPSSRSPIARDAVALLWKTARTPDVPRLIERLENQAGAIEAQILESKSEDVSCGPSPRIRTKCVSEKEISDNTLKLPLPGYRMPWDR